MRHLGVLTLVVTVSACNAPSPSGGKPAPSDTPTRASRVEELMARVHALGGDAPVDADGTLPDVRNHDAASLASNDGKTVIEFPLAHTSVLADVTGNIARVEVTQLYQNPTEQRLEAIYKFPLPQNAAVTDMMFRIGRRVVVSEVKRREEARRTYEMAKREGHTAALTEQERPNLFTQSVANIPPGESVEVVIRYVHEVAFDDGRYQFHFPTTIGPRYNPRDGVADKAAITPPVVAPGVRSAHDLDIVVQLGPADAFAGVAARSHRILSAVDPRLGKRLITLGDGDHLPNKDFILSWRPAAQEPDARILTARDRGDDYFMLFVQPPADVAPAMVRPKELVFLVDKSGSMWGEPLDTARRVIIEALHKMGPEDTFQIITFDSTTDYMTKQALPNTPDNVAAAERWMAKIEGGGGTEMLAGIRAALDQPYDPKRLRMVVFCTDGFIGNEREIIEHIGKMRGQSRVFGFGIGSSVNRYLIEGVAHAGRGAAEIVRQGEPADEAVARLYKRLDRPVLTDVSLRFSGVEVEQMMPSRLPDLFAGQPLVVVGKVRGKGPATVELTGRLGSKPYARTLPVTTRGERDPVLGTLWARRRIAELDDLDERGADAGQKDEIIALALRWKLITQYTSFVAVEKQLKVDTRVPLAQLLVPNELPEGVAYKGIFGEEVAAANADITPARVKPGDPEVRVQAPPTAHVRVLLPWSRRPVRAHFDAPTGDHVARFLVPAGWPDGSWTARVIIDHARGAREERSVELHVDTRAAAIAVVSAPATVHPGEALTLALKPALPVDLVAEALETATPGGAGAALKSAMDVKEIFVRAPWGEIGRARLVGPLGLYTVTLHVPRLAARGATSFEIVASDTAGNVSRRQLAVDVQPASRTAYAGAALLMLLAGSLFARRRRVRA
ncbi:MAG: Vault protein inter-alpha-trypsin domain protein [Myxococcales bacterium]|nr:Vault protein inter-alpha-trypsin domain protein [Myxococcales bacterium]